MLSRVQFTRAPLDQRLRVVCASLLLGGPLARLAFERAEVEDRLAAASVATRGLSKWVRAAVHGKAWAVAKPALMDRLRFAALPIQTEVRYSRWLGDAASG